MINRKVNKISICFFFALYRDLSQVSDSVQKSSLGPFFATIGLNESIEKNHAKILENKLLYKLFGPGLFIIRLA